MKKKSIRHSSQENASLNVGRYINLLLNNIRIICVIVVITSILAFIISYTLPKRYLASSTISIEENIVSSLVEGIAITTSAESKMRLLEVQLLSRDLLSKVISILELDLQARNQKDKENLLLDLRSKTYIRYDSKSGVFYVNFTHENPVIARDFVNSIIRVYIETSTSEKRQESFDATSFLSDQINIFQERIDKAQQDIDQYKTEQGIYLSLDDGFIQQKINSLDQEINNLRIQKNKLISEKHMLSDTAKIDEELRAKENELLSAQSVYTDKHPTLIRIKNEVENIKKRLAESKEKPESESVNTNFQLIQIELNSLEETEKSLIAEREENYQNLEMLPAIKTRLSELEQAKANEMIIYEKLVSRFGQSEVSKQMELQDKAVSFKVIDAAVIPTTFIFPQRYLIMIAGIMAGFGLSFGLLFINSILRPQILSAEDLEIYSIPVLVKLPSVIDPKISAKKRFVDLIFVICACFVICIIFGVAVLEFLGITYVERILPF